MASIINTDFFYEFTSICNIYVICGYVCVTLF